MKKALLVKPMDRYTYAVIPNLGLGYLASQLRNDGFEVIIIDCNKESIDLKAFAEYLSKNKDFHMVGFQLYTNTLPYAKEMIKVVKTTLEDAIIVAGGPHPSGDPAHTLSYIADIDCVITGEAEPSITEIMKLSKKDMSSASALSRIKNVAFRGTGNNVVIGEKVYIEDLDSISFPAWDLIDPRTYPISPHGTFARAYPVAPIITSRGCPFPCTFCAGFQVSGRKIRRRSPGHVLDEIEYLYKDFGVREFHIEDDNFTSKKDYVMDVAKEIMERGLDIWWACPNGIRLDAVDEEMLVAMEKSGCYSIAVGIESGSDSVLKKMKKNLTIVEIEKKIKLIKDTTHISVTGFFLIGYPGETEDDINKTIRLSRRIRIDKASFSPVMPLPGSEIYSDWKKKIDDSSLIWDRFLYYQIVPLVSDIDEKKLKKYIRKALVGFYGRFSIIIGMLMEIRTATQLKILLKRIKTVLFR